MASDSLRVFCKQGVRGSSPLSSTIRYHQVTEHTASLYVDLHDD
jgi:hypothetical protein